MQREHPFSWVCHYSTFFSCSIYVVNITYRVVYRIVMSIKPAIDASFEGAKNAEMRGFRFIHWGKANEQVGPVLEEDIFSQLCPDQSKGIWV